MTLLLWPTSPPVPVDPTIGYIIATDVLAGDGQTRDAYPPDNIVQIRAQIFELGGDPIDTTTLDLKIMAPPIGTADPVISDHTITDLTREATGVYHLNILASTPGQWLYRFATTTPQADTGDESFWVLASRLTSPADAA